MIDKLPEAWEPMVERVARVQYECWRDEVMQYAPPADSSIQAFEDGDWLQNAEENILAFLNAALEAGVAEYGLRQQGVPLTLTLNMGDVK